MPKASFQKHLPHSPEALINFVADVESYPEFVNFISALRVIGERKKTPNGETFDAEMSVSYKFISETVRCNVDVDRVNKTVVVRKSAAGGALKTLTNDWTFYELSDGSALLDFEVDVLLKSTPLNFLARQKFDSVSEKMMGVFVRRAAQVCKTIGGKKDLSKEIAALTVQAGV